MSPTSAAPVSPTSEVPEPPRLGVPDLSPRPTSTESQAGTPPPPGGAETEGVARALLRRAATDPDPLPLIRAAEMLLRRK